MKSWKGKSHGKMLLGVEGGLRRKGKVKKGVKHDALIVTGLKSSRIANQKMCKSDERDNYVTRCTVDEQRRKR